MNSSNSSSDDDDDDDDGVVLVIERGDCGDSGDNQHGDQGCADHAIFAYTLAIRRGETAFVCF